MHGREGAGDTSRPWSENKQDSVGSVRSVSPTFLAVCLPLAAIQLSRSVRQEHTLSRWGGGADVLA